MVSVGSVYKIGPAFFPILTVGILEIMMRSPREIRVKSSKISGEIAFVQKRWFEFASLYRRLQPIIERAVLKKLEESRNDFPQVSVVIKYKNLSVRAHI